MKTADELNQRYQAGDLPWDSGHPDHHLQEFISRTNLQPCHALDIGCGTGTNTIWLAQKGFRAEGIDFSSVAVDMAVKKAATAQVDIKLITGDFLQFKIENDSFDFIYDRGCFHTFDTPGNRRLFAENVHHLLSGKGQWFSIIGSTDGPDRTTGPPRLSSVEITEVLEPYFEIQSIKAVQFSPEFDSSVLGWLCHSKKRRLRSQQNK